MTFQFRDDVERLGKAELLSYIADLEHHVQLGRENVSFDAEANICAAFKATPKEGAVLLHLADGRVHSKESILNALYFDPDEAAEPKIIDVYVCKLRRKLSGSGVSIVTHWGIGYQIEGADVLKRVIAGEPIEWNDEEREAPAVGRPAGVAAARNGEVRDMALLYLHTLADENGVVEVSSRALCVATKGRRQGGDMIQSLTRSGRLEVLRKPRKGGVWKLRLVEK